MTRIITTAAIAIGLLASGSTGQAASGIDALKVLSTLQAQSAAEDSASQQQKPNEKKRPRPSTGGIKGESTDDAHGKQIDIQ